MDLLLDVNIVAGICCKRPLFFKDADLAITQCLYQSGCLWLYAGSVQTLEYVTRGELHRDQERKGAMLSCCNPRFIEHFPRLKRSTRLWQACWHLHRKSKASPRKNQRGLYIDRLSFLAPDTKKRNQEQTTVFCFFAVKTLFCPLLFITINHKMWRL